MTSTIQIDKSSLNAAEEMDLLEKRLMNKLPDEESRNDFKRYIQLKGKSMKIRSANLDIMDEDNSIKDNVETGKHSSLPVDDKPLGEESSSHEAEAVLSKRDQSNMLQETEISDAIIENEIEINCRYVDPKRERMQISGDNSNTPHVDSSIKDQGENEPTELVNTEEEYSENHLSLPVEGKTREYGDEHSSFHAKVRMIDDKDDELGENIPLLNPVSKNRKLDGSLPDEALLKEEEDIGDTAV
jgi:hypothetical protein